MLDLKNIESYKENNRIEAKTALGGLPESIWETYSAFANTLGGYILLGVQEYRDKSFHTVDLPDPEGMADLFWKYVNDPARVSVNILLRENIRIEKVNGCRIIVIYVPMADRYHKPVYVDRNLPKGTYRRNGEGDYHCTEQEIEAMLRDSRASTADMTLISGMKADALNMDSVLRFRNHARLLHPDHIYNRLSDTEFLYRTGALDQDAHNVLHPTAAGLLMFGHHQKIREIFPGYRLIYKDKNTEIDSETEKYCLSDFCYALNQYLSALAFGSRSLMYACITELLVNAIVNADYYSDEGILISGGDHQFSFTNPGTFRIDLSRKPYESDPRNALIQKMFALTDAATASGRGLVSVMQTLKKLGLPVPVFTHSYNPDRVTVTIETTGLSVSLPQPKHRRTTYVYEEYRNSIVSYLTMYRKASSSDIADYLQLSVSYTRSILKKMAQQGILSADGKHSGKVWQLKS